MSYVTFYTSNGEVETTNTTDNEELIELRAKVEALEADAMVGKSIELRATIDELTAALNEIIEASITTCPTNDPFMWLQDIAQAALEEKDQYWGDPHCPTCKDNPWPYADCAWCLGYKALKEKT